MAKTRTVSRSLEWTEDSAVSLDANVTQRTNTDLYGKRDLRQRGAELYSLALMKRSDRRALRDEFSVTHFNVPRSDSCHGRAVRHDDKRGEFFTPDSRQDFHYHLGGF